MFTVMVLEPCCEKTEPDYDPGPRPAWNRTPGAWPPRCSHENRREFRITTHETEESADREFSKTHGWGALSGWFFSGEMPPEGERFRIMPVLGSAGGEFHRHAKPWNIPFPTIDVAREYAGRFAEYPDGARHQYPSLVNIVGDQDTIVRWSSYGIEPGTELYAGDAA